MVIQHDILVAAAGSNQEDKHVVGVELADGINIYMDFVGAGGWERAGSVA